GGEGEQREGGGFGDAGGSRAGLAGDIAIAIVGREEGEAAGGVGEGGGEAGEADEVDGGEGAGDKRSGDDGEGVAGVDGIGGVEEEAEFAIEGGGAGNVEEALSGG